MATRDITLSYIRDMTDPTFNSVAFKTEEEAQAAIDQTKLFDTHKVLSVVFPVTYDEKEMDRRARDWVGESFENYSIGEWTNEEVWDFIEENHHGGLGGFIVYSSLSV